MTWGGSKWTVQPQKVMKDPKWIILAENHSEKNSILNDILKRKMGWIGGGGDLKDVESFGYIECW